MYSFILLLFIISISDSSVLYRSHRPSCCDILRKLRNTLRDRFGPTSLKVNGRFTLKVRKLTNKDFTTELRLNGCELTVHNKLGQVRTLYENSDLLNKTCLIDLNPLYGLVLYKPDSRNLIKENIIWSSAKVANFTHNSKTLAVYAEINEIDEIVILNRNIYGDTLKELYTV